MDRLSQALMSASNRGRLSVLSSGFGAPGAPTYYKGTGTNVVTIPSNVRDGDIGLIWYSSTANQADPPGWVLRQSGSIPSYPTNVTVKVWTNILTAAEAGTTVTISAVTSTAGEVHFAFFRPTKPAVSITIGNTVSQSLGFITENTAYAISVNSTGQTGDIISLVGFTYTKQFTPSANVISDSRLAGITAVKLYQKGEAGDNFTGSFSTWSGYHFYWKFYIKINT